MHVLGLAGECVVRVVGRDRGRAGQRTDWMQLDSQRLGVVGGAGGNRRQRITTVELFGRAEHVVLFSHGHGEHRWQFGDDYAGAGLRVRAERDNRRVDLQNRDPYRQPDDECWMFMDGRQQRVVAEGELFLRVGFCDCFVLREQQQRRCAKRDDHRWWANSDGHAVESQIGTSR